MPLLGMVAGRGAVGQLALDRNGFRGPTAKHFSAMGSVEAPVNDASHDCAGALLARRWRLAVAAALLVGLHVAWVDPRGLVAAPVPPLPDGAARFRVMSANLLMVNDDTEGITQEVLRARPDVFLVQEQSDFSPELLVLDVREGEGRGSDHRPVVADFALAP